MIFNMARAPIDSIPFRSIPAFISTLAGVHARKQSAIMHGVHVHETESTLSNQHVITFANRITLNVHMVCKVYVAI